MSYRKATPQDVGKVCKFRLSNDKAWQTGTIIDAQPTIKPRWGSARLPSWDNIEVPE